MSRTIYPLLLLIFSGLFPLFINGQTHAQISYFSDKDSERTIENIDNATFTPFKKKINSGLSKGIYWVKIESNQHDIVVEIPSAKILKTVCYIDNKELLPVSKSIFPTYNIEKNQQAYISISCQKEAYIPVNIYDKKDFNQYNQNRFMLNGIYYGFSLMVIILNLFYFFSFKEKTFLYYSLFLIGLNLGVFYRDGLMPLIIQNKWWLKYSESLIHAEIVIFGSLFASRYLQHKVYFPRLIIGTMFINTLTVFLYILYILTTNYFYFAYAELTVILVLTIYWISGMLLFFENPHSKIFTIAYSLLLILAIDFFICPLFGLPNIGITTNLLKIGGVFEMIILSYGVVFQMRTLKEENKEIQTALYSYAVQTDQLKEELIKLKEGQKSKLTSADLSQREIEILTMIAGEKTNHEIAEKLFISVNTVKYHMKKLYVKLEIGSRQEAKKKASEIKIHSI